MGIVERAHSKHSRVIRLEGFAGAALISAAVFVASPKIVWGEIDYTTTGNQSWFSISNWNYGGGSTSTGTLPEIGIPGGLTNASNIDANNGTMPSVGVLFDPANDPLTPFGTNANYYANLQDSTLYVSSGSSFTNFSSAAPNKLTIESGTLEANWVTIGRDGSGIVVQNGGTFIADGKFSIQGANHTQTIGSGTYEFHGGTLIVNNNLYVAAGNSLSTAAGAVTATSAGVGKFVIYNDGPDGAILVSNGLIVAGNSLGHGTIGIVEFHYDLNPENIGNVRPVQNDYNPNGDSFFSVGQLRLENGTNTSSRLNLVLDAAPTLLANRPQNLGLFKNQSIAGLGTFPALFYSLSGTNAYTQGATVAATYSGTMYSWTISYSGLIAFDNTATSAYTSSDISNVGGADVVLVGLPVPEPGSLALLGGVGSMILSRRRKRA
jgi:hypothetical protein